MIETIVEQDFNRLFEIEQAAHLVPWSKGTLLNNQGAKYLNLKYTEQDNIIAFAICQTLLDEATLFNLAVDPAFQAQGYAKKLLTALINQLQARGISTLWLEVRQSNTIAQKLYDSVGFNQITIRKNYYPMPDGSRENAVIMALYL
ncbi:ribosomal-protein-alanine N-acetyltransferase [[Haemophilus] ducreyi]|uniref:[Ribosomal protein bS18]-alanine N-acetyltransferase n=2 Tax=Haemophilus ducreyi TaxID=730 RepID=RIMI_HAEDU|nr:ribosomal protein S18-alanine N-acetyltransferase [[Haemophilus] ducreyi]Q7VP85.1 RecName: Full=[Ribosomal protein bS18]-alanine N-acetyltransferase [[Haemophilus] ducreyi 35000HP]AAP95202.1 ribosomal-protein-alanine acetyltransferase [[Haemophilus] ducreyi 35000HP]AKO30354.1 alanine acetyltransferase [[Haemophilus] ducreyi]AKO31786.1 alanine acetyltransferase [[Haemophilus] ducreyi]AKO33238.1 alanine acetyltransferase [[Haemophilus] ducreyi]AKO34688.1 alanine acetyltransferase [[Haemophil